MTRDKIEYIASLKYEAEKWRRIGGWGTLISLSALLIDSGSDILMQHHYFLNQQYLVDSFAVGVVIMIGRPNIRENLTRYVLLYSVRITKVLTLI